MKISIVYVAHKESSNSIEMYLTNLVGKLHPKPSLSSYKQEKMSELPAWSRKMPSPNQSIFPPKKLEMKSSPHRNRFP